MKTIYRLQWWDNHGVPEDPTDERLRNMIWEDRKIAEAFAEGLSFACIEGRYVVFESIGGRAFIPIDVLSENQIVQMAARGRKLRFNIQYDERDETRVSSDWKSEQSAYPPEQPTLQERH